MASKLSAARIASWSGVRTVIARASRANVLLDATSETAVVGTTFIAHDRRLTARKLWIAFAAQVSGMVLVDDGAHSALTTRGVSLLHAGVREVRGDFAAGDTIDVATGNGDVFARGLVGVSALQARAGAGKKSAELPEGVNHEVVHRDDLIVF